MPANTDPYGPPVGAVPSDDIQLIVEGCEILPTMREVGLPQSEGSLQQKCRPTCIPHMWLGRDS